MRDGFSLKPNRKNVNVLFYFAAQVRPVAFAKNARKMSQNTGNHRGVKFASSPRLLSGANVKDVPHITSDTGPPRLVSSANKSVHLTEG